MLYSFGARFSISRMTREKIAEMMETLNRAKKMRREFLLSTGQYKKAMRTIYEDALADIELAKFNRLT